MLSFVQVLSECAQYRGFCNKRNPSRRLRDHLRLQRAVPLWGHGPWPVALRECQLGLAPLEGARSLFGRQVAFLINLADTVSLGSHIENHSDGWSKAPASEAALWLQSEAWNDLSTG